jgi:menaquinone-9 beta-reductase
MTFTARTAFDVLVVGAGLAGSTAAIQLARAGWSVALIERQRFPRRKVCGECLAASNLPLLQALGVGEAFDARAGPALRRVTLLQADRAVTADLPPADHDRHAWGRALGRETLDTLLLEQAVAAGATVFQPWARASHPGARRRMALRASRARVRGAAERCARRWSSMRTAPGSACPRSAPRAVSHAATPTCLAFKANFSGSSLPAGAISVLALDGGYGGMVVADGATTTVACCIRRDRLGALRGAAPGLRRGRCRRGLAAARVRWRATGAAGRGA